MRNLRASTLATLVVIAVLLSGCTGEPEPVETTPLFASEAEAFAAAEETYRAYVDALNQVDLSDPETFEPVFALTTGELYATDRKNFSDWHAAGVSLVGESSVLSVRPQNVTALNGHEVVITIDACYDVANVDVLDSSGNSLVTPDRPTIQSLTVHLSPMSDSSDLAVKQIVASESENSCN